MPRTPGNPKPTASSPLSRRQSASSAEMGHEVRVISPQGMLEHSGAELPGDPPRHGARGCTSRASSSHSAHTRSTLRRKGRSVSPRADTAGGTNCRSRPRITRRYPEYLNARWPIPLSVSYAWLRRFHGAAARTFVSSNSLRKQLSSRGFEHLHRWQRGVNLELFRPVSGPLPAELAGLPRPDHGLHGPGGGREEHRGVPAR